MSNLTVEDARDLTGAWMAELAVRLLRSNGYQAARVPDDTVVLVKDGQRIERRVQNGEDPEQVAHELLDTKAERPPA